MNLENVVILTHESENMHSATVEQIEKKYQEKMAEQTLKEWMDQFFLFVLIFLGISYTIAVWIIFITKKSNRTITNI